MLILVGPSASGKSEIVKELIKHYNMEKLVTYTTRPKRLGEQNGVDYHFIDKTLFNQKKETGFFIETVVYNQQYYGTSGYDLKKGKVVILEPTGLRHYLALGIPCKVCYLVCPKDIRAKRMLKRGDAPLAIAKRLAQDEVIFDESVRALADWIIESYGEDVALTSRRIARLYWEEL